MNIWRDNLTILFQGKFDQHSVDNIKKTISNISCSCVIISCWEGDLNGVDISELPSVKFIFSNDPGSKKIDGYKIDNINRQIVSTKSGLDAVETEYVLKLRTDTYITSNNLIKLGNKLIGSCKSTGEIFSERVMVTNLTTLDADKTDHCFHVCDWLFMGRLKDIKRVFSLEIKPDEYFTFFSSDTSYVSEICSQHRAETALIEHVVRDKGIRINCENTLKVERMDKVISNRILYNDFIILNPWTIDLRSTKHSRLNFWIDGGRILESQWRAKNNVKIAWHGYILERVYLTANFLIKILVKFKKLMG
jgi:hypothetical protein